MFNPQLANASTLYLPVVVRFDEICHLDDLRGQGLVDGQPPVEQTGKRRSSLDSVRRLCSIAIYRLPIQTNE